MTDAVKVSFKGTVVKCVFNSENYKIYALDVNKESYPDIKYNKYNNVSITGDLPELSVNVEYEITGKEEISDKYGIAYKVINIKSEEPKNARDMYVFLQEILTENQAYALWNAYPDIVERVKENRLEDVDLSKIKGVGEKIFEKIKKKIISNYYLIELVSEFKGVLSLSMLKKIYDKYSSVEVLKKKLKNEPYTTLTRINGIGFKTADLIVVALDKEHIIDFGYDIKTSPDRCLACVLYILQENENNGHTKENLAETRKQCSKIVPECAHHFENVIQDESIYYNKETMEIALKSTYNAEYKIAATIISALKNNNHTWDYNVKKYKNIDGFELTDEQINALDNLCKYSISILNGSGGTGKSSCTKAIVNMLEEHNRTFKLLSPTGKASKVLSSYTGHTASTIHRGLGYIPEQGWTFNEENKLDYSVVIVDESSMIDVKLFRHLIEAIDFNTTKLLIIGDNAQLPSVGCGNLLHDFMNTNIIPTTTLTKVFRYSDGGLMRVATDCRMCKPFLNKEMKSKMINFGENKDYTFVDIPASLVSKNAIALYKKLLDNGASIENIQVLSAKNVGECGTIELNNMIQKIANKNYGSNDSMKYGETTYYVGDLVLQTQNDYKAKIDINYLSDQEREYWLDEEETPTAFVANGENGIVAEICTTYMTVNFDGIYIKYSKEGLGKLSLGYAISIHRSQGSQCDNIILCTPQSHTFMLNSNLIYVGISRTKEKCFHLGSLNTVNRAVLKKENLKRNTFMSQLLLDIMRDKLLDKAE